MKIIDCEQGSPEWLSARLGIPTASEFERVVTPTGKLSTQARRYAFYLVAERLLNRTLDSISNLEWIARGKELEPTAAKMYAFETGLETKPVGFVTTDDGRMGCSPDRLVIGENAAIELKCPAPQTHIEYLLDGFGRDYFVQVQGQLLIGEFEWVDRYSFHPDMPPVTVRTYRDEPFIAKLSAALEEFNDMREALYEHALALGAFNTQSRVETAHEQAYKGGDANLYVILDPFDPKHGSDFADFPGNTIQREQQAAQEAAS